MNGIVEIRDLETFGPATVPGGGEVEILFTPLAGLAHAAAGIAVEPAGPRPDPSDLSNFPSTVAAGELEVSLFSARRSASRVQVWDRRRDRPRQRRGDSRARDRRRRVAVPGAQRSGR